MKAFALAFAFAFAVTGAGVYAQDATIENASLPTVQTDAAPVVSQTLLLNFVKICKGGYVLTEKATAACAANVTPKTNKTGDAFRNTGIGIEFNTLIRNMK